MSLARTARNLRYPRYLSRATKGVRPIYIPPNSNNYPSPPKWMEYGLMGVGVAMLGWMGYSFLEVHEQHMNYHRKMREEEQEALQNMEGCPYLQDPTDEVEEDSDSRS